MRPIDQAESNRVQARFARTLAQTNTYVVPFPNVPLHQRAEYLQAWRIRATTYGSMSTQVSNGNESAVFLSQEREILRTYYTDSAVQASAKEESTRDYLILPEMYRDWGLYLGKLTALTGNSAYLDQSVVAFSRAIELSPPKSSVHNLAIVEKFGINRRRGEKGKFKDLKQAYRRVIASDAGGWDRKAAVSTMYIAQSKAQRRIDGVIEGELQLARALRNAKKEHIIFEINGKEKKASVRSYKERRRKSITLEQSRRKSFTWSKDEIVQKLELPEIRE